MKIRSLSVLLFPVLCLTAGCGTPKPAVPEIQAENPTAEAAENALQNADITMEGINLYMHRPDNHEGVPSRPELWVQAESFSIGDDKVYAFKEAAAVLYGKDETEEIRLHANQGIFKQDHFAKMDGDIRMTAGAMKIFLLDLQWDRSEEDAAGVVHSDQPVIIDDPDLQLNASSLRLVPDTKIFEMDNVSGVVRFGKEMS